MVSLPEKVSGKCVNNSISEYPRVRNIAIEILEQKSHCQQDPDQDEAEVAPEDQAEYDSVLIASAGDLVSSFASALGGQFDFAPFFRLISKYYVRVFFTFVDHCMVLTIAYRRRVVPPVTGLFLLVAWRKSLQACRVQSPPSQSRSWSFSTVR